MSQDNIVNLGSVRSAASRSQADWAPIEALRWALAEAEEGRIVMDRLYIATASVAENGGVACDFVCAGFKNQLEIRGLLYEHITRAGEK